MKIAVYGMTPWEQEELKKLPLREAPEYVFVDDILREETLKYVEGCQAVSILSNAERLVETEHADTEVLVEFRHIFEEISSGLSRLKLFT